MIQEAMSSFNIIPIAPLHEMVFLHQPFASSDTLNAKIQSLDGKVNRKDQGSPYVGH